MEEVVKEVINRMKPEANVCVSQDLVSTGILDSFDLLMLVSELEGTLGISIPGVCLTPENFHSIKSISVLLSSLKET